MKVTINGKQLHPVLGAAITTSTYGLSGALAFTLSGTIYNPLFPPLLKPLMILITYWSAAASVGLLVLLSGLVWYAKKTNPDKS